MQSQASLSLLMQGYKQIPQIYKLVCPTSSVDRLSLICYALQWFQGHQILSAPEAYKPVNSWLVWTCFQHSDDAMITSMFSLLRCHVRRILYPDTGLSTAAVKIWAAARLAMCKYKSDYRYVISSTNGTMTVRLKDSKSFAGALNVISDPANRAVAGSIGNAESYHSTLIRTLLSQILNTKPAYGLSVDQITSTLVTALNGLTKAQLKFPLSRNGGFQVSNTDTNGKLSKPAL